MTMTYVFRGDSSDPIDPKLEVFIPDLKVPINISLDYYGEKFPMFSLMCYSTNRDLIDVQVRYDEYGNVAEVYVGKDILVVRDEEPDGQPPPWLLKRDGWYDQHIHFNPDAILKAKFD